MTSEQGGMNVKNCSHGTAVILGRVKVKALGGLGYAAFKSPLSTLSIKVKNMNKSFTDVMIKGGGATTYDIISYIAFIIRFLCDYMKRKKKHKN